MVPRMGSSLKIGLILFTVAAVGCGGSSSGDGTGDGDGDGTDVDAAVPADYTRLIGRTWSLPPGARDTYRCVRVTVPTDTYITNIQALAPQGTHHTVLSIANSSSTRGPDGEYDCSVSTLGLTMLYASGVGTSPLDFPEGVGIKIAAGQQIHLNLHLYNSSDAELSGDSAIMVKQSSTPPPMLAENVFAGRFWFTIDGQATPRDMRQEVVGGCTVNQPYTLFAVWPHMHQLAVHQKVELIRGAAPATVLHDDEFSFLEQNYYRQDPMVQVQAGDQIRVTCTYVNETGQDVRFGDSSDTEMCFAGLYRYPARDAGLFECTDVPGGIPF